jgi:hypothetical protein
MLHGTCDYVIAGFHKAEYDSVQCPGDPRGKADPEWVLAGEKPGKGNATLENGPAGDFAGAA